MDFLSLFSPVITGSGELAPQVGLASCPRVCRFLLSDCWGSSAHRPVGWRLTERAGGPCDGATGALTWRHERGTSSSTICDLFFHRKNLFLMICANITFSLFIMICASPHQIFVLVLSYKKIVYYDLCKHTLSFVYCDLCKHTPYFCPCLL